LDIKAERVVGNNYAIELKCKKNAPHEEAPRSCEAERVASIVRTLGLSSRRAADEEISRVFELDRERYVDFTVKHFHEQLVKRHGYKLGYTVTKVLHERRAHRPSDRNQERP
jgi:hypothetical protein